MGSCYSGDHIAGDDIHTNNMLHRGATTDYRVGTVEIDYRGQKMFNWIQTLALFFYFGSKHLVRIIREILSLRFHLYLCDVVCEQRGHLYSCPFCFL